uniref:Uncharacterized protein n=1 Tax=Anguilla anguilla TaxID=7936 RepID=A0A0E9QK21_ANGAN
MGFWVKDTKDTAC